MATGNKRYWGTITPLAASMLAMQAKMPPANGLGIDKLVAYSGAIARTFYG